MGVILREAGGVGESISLFKESASKARLPDDGHKDACFYFLMIRDRHGDGAARNLSLQDNMTSSPSDFLKSLFSK
jgi:hypothetical protein